MIKLVNTGEGKVFLIGTQQLNIEEIMKLENLH